MCLYNIYYTLLCTRYVRSCARCSNIFENRADPTAQPRRSIYIQMWPVSRLTAPTATDHASGPQCPRAVVVCRAKAKRAKRFRLNTPRKHASGSSGSRVGGRRNGAFFRT